MSEPLPHSPAAAAPNAGMKTAKTAITIANVASFVLAFTPFWLTAAAVQAGVTLAQTAMDFKEKGAKKAAWTFAGGALMTGFFLIPALGGIAKGAGIVAKTAAEAGKASEATNAGVNAVRTAEGAGMAAEGASVANGTAKTGLFANAKEKMNSGWKATKAALNEVPFVPEIVGGVRSANTATKAKWAAAKTSFKGLPVIKQTGEMLTKTEARLNAPLIASAKTEGTLLNKAASWKVNNEKMAKFAGSAMAMAPMALPNGDAPEAAADEDMYRTDHAADVLKRREAAAAKAAGPRVA